MVNYGIDNIPLNHEFGIVLKENFHHFVSLQKIMEGTINEWYGCGSYLIDGRSLDYTNVMYDKQRVLYEESKNAKSVLEIGVHGGHSLLIMLLANPKLNIDCIDICMYTHTIHCIEYLKKTFTEADIKLHVGSSLDVLPKLNLNIDIAHIDGAHEIDFIEKEVSYILNYVSKGSKIIFDDCDTQFLLDYIHTKWNDKLKLTYISNCNWANCITELI